MPLDALSPHFFQVAYVVRDIEEAERWHQRVFGVPSFMRMPDVAFQDGCVYRGQPAEWKAHLSIGYLSGIQVELIQSVEGPSLYTEFLDAKGPGLHHVAFSVPDFDATVKGLVEEGLEPVAEGMMGPGCRFAYFDCERDGASVVEILGFDEATASFMDSLKEQAAAALASSGGSAT